MASYLQKRGSVYYYVRRYPDELLDRYPRESIRISLKTKDERAALRAMERLNASYEAEWAAMLGNPSLTPAQTHNAAQALADQLGPMEVAADYFADLFNAHASKVGFAGHPRDARKKGLIDPRYADEAIKESDYLDPVQQRALALIRAGNSQAPRLSAALTAYITNHKNANNKRFVAQAERDWGRLTSLAGDIAIIDLSREQARRYQQHCAAQGMKSTSTRRCINNVNAILNFGIKELDVRGASNPFSDLSIPNEGRDAKKVKTPSPTELHEIMERFGSDTSDTGLIVMLQMGLGTRVSEVVGRLVTDIMLDAETPHVVFQPQADRDLKNDNSIRKVPLVGFALEAAKAAVKKAGKNPDLFARYAKENGNTNASAAVNKRLKEWEIGTHGFRHGMTDLLRAAGCPADIRKEITGHAAAGMDGHYGEGYGLKQRAEWIGKALALIQPAKPASVAPEALQDTSDATA